MPIFNPNSGAGATAMVPCSATVGSQPCSGNNGVRTAMP
jgi:hypothetical protein